MGISLLTAPSHAERSSSKASFRRRPSPPGDPAAGRASAAGSRWCGREQERPRNRPQDLLTRALSPPRYTVGVADRLCSAPALLCLSENIQHGNLTPLLKIAEFTRFQLEVPLLKCDNGEQIPRLISKRQHVQPGGAAKAQRSSSGLHMRFPARTPYPGEPGARSAGGAGCPLPGGRPRSPPNPPRSRRDTPSARPAGRSPAPPSSGGALASQAPPTASAPGLAASAALHPSGGRRDVKKVTSSQGD